MDREGALLLEYTKGELDMPIFRNNDEKQGRYCIHKLGHVTFHEASQKTKGDYRECEESDLPAFTEHLLIHAGRKEAPPAASPTTAPMSVPVVVKIEGTVRDA